MSINRYSMLSFIRIAVPWGERFAGVRHARGRGRRRGEAAAHVAGLWRVAGVGLLHAQLARSSRHPRDHRMNSAVRRVTLGYARPHSATLGRARVASHTRGSPWVPLVTPVWRPNMDTHCQSAQRLLQRETLLVSEVDGIHLNLAQPLLFITSHVELAHGNIIFFVISRVKFWYREGKLN